MWQANPVVVTVGLTVRAMVVLDVVLPEAPVMVTVAAPVVARRRYPTAVGAERVFSKIREGGTVRASRARP